MPQQIASAIRSLRLGSGGLAAIQQAERAAYLSEGRSDNPGDPVRLGPQRPPWAVAAWATGSPQIPSQIGLL